MSRERRRHIPGTYSAISRAASIFTHVPCSVCSPATRMLTISLLVQKSGRSLKFEDLTTKRAITGFSLIYYPRQPLYCWEDALVCVKTLDVMKPMGKKRWEGLRVRLGGKATRRIVDSKIVCGALIPIYTWIKKEASPPVQRRHEAASNGIVSISTRISGHWVAEHTTAQAGQT